MSATNTLKDYQANILARLDDAKKIGASATAGYLGVIIAGKNVLINMLEISETLPLMEIFPVPLVKEWFLGVANVRGVLYVVNDIGQLISDEKTTMSSNSRVILLNNEVTSHVAILVERLVGLRKLDVMRSVNTKAKVDFCMKPETYEDEEGKLWYVMDCEKLIRAKEFVQSY
ncbi:MAG TPA: chemotaxis protein CheW [Methylophilaceae bacterium]|nr:chemotaxis protein CheW [Methylophilaceae bacterium]HAJ73072.1 chemotaxis protein CheW [Methylophilaceae bacterium]